MDLCDKDLERIAEAAAEKAVKRTLTSLGIDSESPYAVQADMMYLRDWRLSSERIKSRGLLAIVAAVATGLTAAVYIGVKSMLVNGGVPPMP